MFEKLWNYCEREWQIVKNAPLACLVLFGISCFVLFSVMNWHYEGRLDTLKEQIKTYEVKLEVTSPDQAMKKVTALNKSLDEANQIINNIKNNNPYESLFYGTDLANECDFPNKPKTNSDKDTAVYIAEMAEKLDICRILLGKEPKILKQDSIDKPICISKDDILSEHTMRSILSYNEMLNTINNGKFTDHCNEKR